MQHTERHRRVDLVLAFDQQVDELAVGQRQSPDSVGHALAHVRAYEVRVGGIDRHDLGEIDAGQGIGVQQMADEGLIEHEELEGGIARDAHFDDRHGSNRAISECGSETAEPRTFRDCSEPRSLERDLRRAAAAPEEDLCYDQIARRNAHRRTLRHGGRLDAAAD